jgi:hypothetical protein
MGKAAFAEQAQQAQIAQQQPFHKRCKNALQDAVDAHTLNR